MHLETKVPMHACMYACISVPPQGIAENQEDAPLSPEQDGMFQINYTKQLSSLNVTPAETPALKQLTALD